MTVSFSVSHRTRYRYSTEVGLGYNRAHLLPRATSRQRVLSSSLAIDPAPDDRWDTIDADGNLLSYFSIERPHRHLEVTAHSEVTVGGGAAGALPAGGGPWERLAADLAQVRHPAAAFAFDSPLVARSAELAGYAGPSFPPGRPLVEAVGDLNHRIHTEFRYLPGSTTVSTPAEEVLRRRQGVCQDFAHLAIGCLRSLGLAARYVSGYLETLPPAGQPVLVGSAVSHAWCSVLLADGSWLDLDPTNDLVDPPRHVTVAWGRDYRDVTPLSGIIYASGVRSELEVAVHVSRLEAGAS